MVQRGAGHTQCSPARAKRVWTVPVAAWVLAPEARRRVAAKGAAAAESVSASATARRRAIIAKCCRREAREGHSRRLLI